MLLGVLVVALLLAWWLTGSYWPILPTWVLFCLAFALLARTEGRWVWPSDLTYLAGLGLLAATPHAIRRHIREQRLARLRGVSFMGSAGG